MSNKFSVGQTVHRKADGKPGVVLEVIPCDYEEFDYEVEFVQEDGTNYQERRPEDALAA